MANARMNTHGIRSKSSPMSACEGAARLGAREGRSASRSTIDWKQRGKDELQEVLRDSGEEANRLWDLAHGIR